MDTFTQGYDMTMNTVEGGLNTALANPYVKALVTIFVIFYSGLAAPKLPKPIAKLFDYTAFKILVLALILLANQFDSSLSLMVAVAFFISLQTLTRYKVMETASEVLKIRQLVAMAKRPLESVQPRNDDNDADDMPTSNPVAIQTNYGVSTGDQVSGLASRTRHYLGPQGLQHPVGFAGPVMGAEY